MKKFLALVIALVMVLTLSASAFAEGTESICAREEDPYKTSDLPDLIKGYLKLTAFKDRKTLAEYQLLNFEAGRIAVKDCVPEDMIARYVVYAQASDYPATGTVKMFNFTDIVVKMFVDGEWENVTVTDNHDDSVEITINNEGTLAFFTNP